MATSKGWTKEDWLHETENIRATKGFPQRISRATKGSAKDALENLDGLLAKAIKKNGLESVPVTMIQMALADQLERLDRFGEARLFRVVVLETFREQLGVDASLTLEREIELATTLGKLGEHGPSSKLLRHVFDLRLRTLGPEDRSTLKVQSSLGAQLYEDGQLDEARSVFQGFHDVCERTLGTDSAEVAAAQEWLEQIDAREDQPDDETPEG